MCDHCSATHATSEHKHNAFAVKYKKKLAHSKENHEIREKAKGMARRSGGKKAYKSNQTTPFVPSVVRPIPEKK